MSVTVIVFTLEQVNKALAEYGVKAIEDVTSDKRFYNRPFHNKELDD